MPEVTLSLVVVLSHLLTAFIASSVASSSGASLIGASGYRFKRDELKSGKKFKLKKLPTMKRKISETNGMNSAPSDSLATHAYYAGAKEDASSSGSESPIGPEMDEETMASFPSGKPREEQLDTVICKHCKRPVLKRTAREHIVGCLRSKQEKARKKKEAREAAARAKEKAERGDDKDSDEEDEIKIDAKGGSARKSAVKGANGEDASKKGKKRKADVEDDKDKEPKKKKKKEEPKPKAPKPKGPVDVEKQCGVALPNGAQCARSLTCKSHSMGAKRAVPGRSLPYDMLLQAYQKKNQAKMQSKPEKGISTSWPFLILLQKPQSTRTRHYF